MSSARPRVLLVEDRASSDRIALGRLPDDEFRMRRANTLAQALRLLARGHFDAVVLDPKLPDSDGAHTLRSLRGQAPDVPVVVVSSSAASSVRECMLELGAQDFLVKADTTPEILSRCVRQARQRPRVRDETLRLSPGRPVVRGSRGPARGDAMSYRVQALVVDADAEVLSAVEHTLESAGCRVLTARAGEEALDALQEHAPELDLVILDVGLSAAQGHGVIAAVQREAPQAALILTARAPGGMEWRPGGSAAASAWLWKPCSRDRLLRVVRSSLEWAA